MTTSVLRIPKPAGIAAGGGSATGGLDIGGGCGWFAMTLEAGRIYRIDLVGTHGSGGSPSGPYLWGIHDVQGGLVGGTWNDDGGTGYNSRGTFTATESGTYYVSISACGDRESTGTLSVTDLTDGFPDDFTAWADTACTVAVGGSATGEIKLGGDRDWFAVVLEAGQDYRFDLEGEGTGGGTLYGPHLGGIHDESGALIKGTTGSPGDTGCNSRVTFTATEDAIHYVSAGACGYREGTYRLSVTCVTDRPAGDIAAGIDSADAHR